MFKCWLFCFFFIDFEDSDEIVFRYVFGWKFFKNISHKSFSSVFTLKNHDSCRKQELVELVRLQFPTKIIIKGLK